MDTEQPQFMGTTWVIKRYLPSAVKRINSIGQTVQQHPKGGSDASSFKEFCFPVGTKNC